MSAITERTLLAGKRAYRWSIAWIICAVLLGIVYLGCMTLDWRLWFLGAATVLLIVVALIANHLQDKATLSIVEEVTRLKLDAYTNQKKENSK